MAKAEVGTPKYVANKMKSKGLQRLRWYCQGEFNIINTIMKSSINNPLL